MRIYLAARYSRREELCGYRDQLRALGHVVTSRWLNWNHQISDDEISCPGSVTQNESFTVEDLDDLLEANCVISFTEPPRQPSSNRGGRDVELGIAIGRRDCYVTTPRIVVVGPRENVFRFLPYIEHFESWDAALGCLSKE